MGVMGGVAGTRDDDDAAVYQALVEGGRRLVERRRAVAAQELEHRDRDAAGEPSARISRSEVGTAATRTGQTGLARYASSSGSGIRTISRKNVCAAASRSPAPIWVAIRSSTPDGR